MKKNKENDNPQERDWYSIKEAAEYLGVSQPTIFRWMKQGTLSFYKVGASTRFAKDGLDSVIEKSTGQKEAEIAASRCAACGHHILVDGQIQGTGRLYFRPERGKFWVLSEGLVPTYTRVCAACGYLQIHADTTKLKQLSKDDLEEETKGGEKK